MAFAFPKCWNDDQTMNFRFQPFRDRSSNPVAYDAKMTFWKELIIDICCSSMLTDGCGLPLSLTHSRLTKVCTRNGRSPKCLPTVLEELQRDGLITEYQTYQVMLDDVVQRQRASWTSWSYQVMVSSPLKKLANRVVSVVSPKSPSAENTRYVVHSNVKSVAQKLLQKVRQQVNSSCIGADYKLLLGRQRISNLIDVEDQELDLLLLWLESEKYMIPVSIDDLGTVYKFSRADGSKVQSLTDVERGVLQIQHTRDKLEASISHRQQRLQRCIIEIKSKLANKNRTLALRSLRQKKAIELSMAKEEDHLHKLDCILDEIYMSATNQLVLQAFGRGTSALNSLNDLNPVDTVNSTMDSLSDSLATSKEITEALISPVSNDVADEESLERELADLLSEPAADDGLDSLLERVDNLVVTDNKVETKRKSDSAAVVSAS